MSESTAAEIIRKDADACERWMDSLRSINRAYLEDAWDARLQYMLYCVLSVVVPVAAWSFAGPLLMPMLTPIFIIAGACFCGFFGGWFQINLEIMRIRSWEKLLEDEMHGRPKVERNDRHVRLARSKHTSVSKGSAS